eukprot:TRINITY_DN36095_c0_g1_i1.p1 TRINITY_DN36095_c0_g1~~TRINITY_DN36095_c0_g1_i1.p1  ORF type:complete len:757 (+),score=201.04 TRINITY_DN36095_c0_g1_i1:64-2334(+)
MDRGKLQEANQRLRSAPYLRGYAATAADAELFDALFGGSSAVADWAGRMAGYHRLEREAICGAGPAAPRTGKPPAGQKPAKKDVAGKQQQQHKPKPKGKGGGGGGGADAPPPQLVTCACEIERLAAPAPAPPQPGSTVWAAVGAAGSTRLCLNDVLSVVAADAARRRCADTAGRCFVGCEDYVPLLKDALGLLDDWQFSTGPLVPDPVYWSETAKSHLAVGNCPASKEPSVAPPLSVAGNDCATVVTPRCLFTRDVLPPARPSDPAKRGAAADAGGTGFVPPTTAARPPGVHAPLPFLHPADGLPFLFPSADEAKELAPDVLRGYLLYHYVPAADAGQGAALAKAVDASPPCSVSQFVNSGLVGCLANVSFRVLSYVAKKLDGGKVPAKPAAGTSGADAAVAAHTAAVAALQKVSDACGRFQFAVAVRTLFEAFKALEAYLNAVAPWKLVKEDPPAAAAALWAGSEVVIAGARAAAPLLPGWSRSVLACAPGIASVAAGCPLQAPGHLYQRVESAPTLAIALPGELRFEKHPEAWSCVVVEYTGLAVPRRSAEADRWKEAALKAAAESVASKRYQKHIDEFRQTPAIVADPALQHSVQNLQSLFESTGKLPGINVLVDVYNLVSLRDGLVMGAYDVRATRDGVLRYGRATGDEHFVPLNFDELDGGADDAAAKRGFTQPVQPGEFLVQDTAGNVITTFCKQSVSSAVTATTTAAFMMVWGNPLTPQSLLRKAAGDITEAVTKLCGASVSSRVIFDG